MLENERTKPVQISSDVYHRSHLDPFSKKSAFLHTLPKKFQMCLHSPVTGVLFFAADSCSEEIRQKKKTQNIKYWFLLFVFPGLKGLFRWSIPLANLSINFKLFDQTQYWLFRRNRKKLYQMSRPYNLWKARWPQCPATLAAMKQGSMTRNSTVEWNSRCNTAKV